MVELRLGVLVAPIAEQLAAQGLEHPEADVMDDHRRAINRLRFAGLLTESESKRAQQRLFMQIASAALTQSQEG